MMYFSSVGTRLISQKSAAHSISCSNEWEQCPLFRNCNTVYRNCTVLCDTILPNVSQSHRQPLNQKRSHWLLVVIVWLRFIFLYSWWSEDQHQQTTQLLWRLRLLWARTTCQKLQVDNFSASTVFQYIYIYFFFTDVRHVCTSLLASSCQ